MNRFQLILCTAALSAGALFAADQTKVGAGNDRAAALAADSPLVQTSQAFLIKQINRIQDSNLRIQTLDATRNRNTCIAFRANVTEAMKTAMIQKLTDQGLVDVADEANITGGIRAGIFPPVLNDGTDCPKTPQPFYSAPGGATNGHHSYPGGLMIHETFNTISNLNLAAGYRRVYGASRADGMPVVGDDMITDELAADVFLSQDITVAAPIWHDWAKSIVFQWNADGTEFTELSFGGNGKTDNFGAAGSSKTGGHHIMGIAEAMKRGLAPDYVIAHASAHSVPTNGNEFQVVNWIRAAGILAQIDPVAQGYLMMDSQGRMRLPALRSLGSVDLLAGATSLSHVNVLAEYVLHNISDSDFSLTGPAVTEAAAVLAAVAAQYGATPSDLTNYNNKFRNPVLAYLSAERLLILYANGGTDAVIAEINKIRGKLTAGTTAPTKAGVVAVATRKR